MQSITFLPSAKGNIGVVWETFIVRLKIISRYKGALFMDCIVPTLFAAMPILLGSSLSGSINAASQNFQANTGLTGVDYVAYIVIGANVFSSVTAGMWLFGFFIRREQMLGTLESISMSPSHKLGLLGGLTMYVTIRSLFTFITGYFIGCILFGLNPFQGNFVLALLILSFGLIPIYGLSFLLGALILKVKEANSLLNTLQWGLGIIMGVFFPVTALPIYLRAIAYIFPGYFVNHTVQATLTNLGYFFGNLYFDLAILFLFALVCPFLGYTIYSKVEGRMKKAEGIGQF